MAHTSMATATLNRTQFDRTPSRLAIVVTPNPSPVAAVTGCHLMAYSAKNTPARHWRGGMVDEALMCRNIKTLYNFEPPATQDEIRASSLQFVRKLSGFARPSKQNEEAFNLGSRPGNGGDARVAGDTGHQRSAPRPRGRGRQGEGAVRGAVRCLPGGAGAVTRVRADGVVAIQMPANTATRPRPDCGDRLADELRRQQARRDRVDRHGVGDPGRVALCRASTQRMKASAPPATPR